MSSWWVFIWDKIYILNFIDNQYVINSFFISLFHLSSVSGIIIGFVFLSYFYFTTGSTCTVGYYQWTSGRTLSTFWFLSYSSSFKWTNNCFSSFNLMKILFLFPSYNLWHSFLVWSVQLSMLIMMILLKLRSCSKSILLNVITVDYQFTHIHIVVCLYE